MLPAWCKTSETATHPGSLAMKRKQFRVINGDVTAVRGGIKASRTFSLFFRWGGFFYLIHTKLYVLKASKSQIYTSDRKYIHRRHIIQFTYTQTDYMAPYRQ
jgi:hypothetical protein